MEDLKEKSGLAFELKEDSLEYNKEEYSASVDWQKQTGDGVYAYRNQETSLDVLYFGARYTENSKDEQIFLDNDFMADFTVINAGKVGKEFVKTVGHYHGLVPGQAISYPEVYEAISPNMEYLLQSEPDEENQVDVIWVVTEPGDKVVMPPGYGHVSMNVGNEPAVEVDVQRRDNPNDSDYSVFKKNCGGALYRTAEGLEENSNYKVKSLRIVRPLEKPEWGLIKDVPLYKAVVEHPEKFKYLNEPQNYKFDDLFVDAEL